VVAALADPGGSDPGQVTRTVRALRVRAKGSTAVEIPWSSIESLEVLPLRGTSREDIERVDSLVRERAQLAGRIREIDAALAGE
jgi:hypothetical protein